VTNDRHPAVTDQSESRVVSIREYASIGGESQHWGRVVGNRGWLGRVVDV